MHVNCVGVHGNCNEQLQLPFACIRKDREGSSHAGLPATVQSLLHIILYSYGVHVYSVLCNLYAVFNFLSSSIRYRFCRKLEETSYSGRTADFIVLLLFGAFFTLVSLTFSGLHVFARFWDEDCVHSLTMVQPNFTPVLSHSLINSTDCSLYKSSPYAISW